MKKLLMLFGLLLTFTNIADARLHKPIARSGTASWHDYDRENKSYYKYGRKMAASVQYPCGTKLKVFNKANKKWTFVTICDWGPHPRLNRTIDLNKSVFNKIGNIGTGTMRITYYVVKKGNCRIHRH